MMKRFLILLLAFTLMTCGAMAETLTMDGQVVSVETVTVLSPVSATVAELPVAEGDRIATGDTLLTLRTEKVYAEQAGTVAVFGETGDTVSAIESRYGAVVVLEPDEQFTVDASTRNAYSTENKLVHVGRTVYLRTTNEGNRKGKGLITAASGSSFTVKITDGDLTLDDSVQIFSSSDYETVHRIGSGTVSRVENLTYTGSGTVVAFHVKNRSHVEKGDLLYETLSGSFEAGKAGREITAEADGVIASLNVSEGSSVSENGVICEIWPDTGMRVHAGLSENDVSSLAVGDSVSIAFDADPEKSYTGTVERISRTAQDSTASEAVYTVTIAFEGTADVRYGMHATVTKE